MKKQLLKTLIVAAFAAASVIVPSAPAFADSKKPAVWLQISPVANRVTLNPNDNLTYKMEVNNIGSKKFKFRVYAAPYSIANEAYEVSFSSETKRTQVSRWVTFNQNKDAKNDAEKDWKNEAVFELDPDQRQEVEYKITVPSDIPAGGQYATIFAESIPGDAATSTGVRTISRVGLILYGRTNGETIEESTIENFTANMTMEISKIIGGEVAKIDNPYPIIPDAPTRHATLEWKETPVFGIFRVKTIITALDKRVEETKIVLILPVFIIIIMLVLLTIIIAWLIILIRKRRAEKSRLIV